MRSPANIVTAQLGQHRRIQIGSSPLCEEPRQLIEAIARWSELLTAVDGFGHVRCLRINLDSSFDQGYETWEAAWEALAHFVKRLRCLTDLTYDSDLPDPAPVLATLHSEAHSRTACRLHVKQFDLPSLSGPAYDDESGDFELSPEDLLLATSPYLYSLGLKLSQPPRNHVNFCLKAVQLLVQGANPHLKEVDISREYRYKAQAPANRPAGQRLRTWQGFATSNPQQE